MIIIIAGLTINIWCQMRVVGHIADYTIKFKGFLFKTESRQHSIRIRFLLLSRRKNATPQDFEGENWKVLKH